MFLGNKEIINSQKQITPIIPSKEYERTTLRKSPGDFELSKSPTLSANVENTSQSQKIPTFVNSSNELKEHLMVCMILHTNIATHMIILILNKLLLKGQIFNNE